MDPVGGPGTNQSSMDIEGQLYINISQLNIHLGTDSTMPGSRHLVFTERTRHSLSYIGIIHHFPKKRRESEPWLLQWNSVVFAFISKTDWLMDGDMIQVGPISLSPGVLLECHQPLHPLQSPHPQANVWSSWRLSCSHEGDLLRMKCKTVELRYGESQAPATGFKSLDPEALEDPPGLHLSVNWPSKFAFLLMIFWLMFGFCFCFFSCFFFLAFYNDKSSLFQVEGWTSIRKNKSLRFRMNIS